MKQIFNLTSFIIEIIDIHYIHDHIKHINKKTRNICKTNGEIIATSMLSQGHLKAG